MDFLRENKFVQYNGGVINYELVRKNVKNINLRIRANGSVSVSANENISEEAINDFVIKKAEFIIRHVNRFRELQKYAPTKKQYVSGESFYLLGKNLRLKIIEGDKKEVFSDGVYLHLKIKKQQSLEQKKKIVNSFFDEQCRLYFNQIIIEMFPIFSKYGVNMPVLKIRNMETRWGSCMPKKGIITLNKRLLEVPLPCIEYVVLHEYCHFIHPNHSKQFYGFVSMLMPDWKERKKVLESIYIKNY